MAGIEKWTKMIVLFFEEKLSSCSNWGKWVKCWNQEGIVVTVSNAQRPFKNDKYLPVL